MAHIYSLANGRLAGATTEIPSEGNGRRPKSGWKNGQKMVFMTPEYEYEYEWDLVAFWGVP